MRISLLKHDIVISIEINPNCYRNFVNLIWCWELFVVIFPRVTIFFFEGQKLVKKKICFRGSEKKVFNDLLIRGKGELEVSLNETSVYWL